MGTVPIDYEGGLSPLPVYIQSLFRIENVRSPDKVNATMGRLNAT